MRCCPVIFWLASCDYPRPINATDRCQVSEKTIKMSAQTQLKMQVNTISRLTTQQSRSALSQQNQSTSDALAMQVMPTNPATGSHTEPGELPDLPTHVVRLSHEGLRFNHCERFDPAQRIWLRLRLGRVGVEKSVLVTAAEVIDCESKKDHLGEKCFDTRVRFIDSTTAFQLVVRQHIDDVLSQIHKNCRQYDYVPGGLTHTAA